MLYRPTTRWTWIFFLSLLLEALIAIPLEIALLIDFLTYLRPKADQVTASRTFPSFLSFIILGFLYQLVFAYDTLAHQNTIQLYGLCAYSIVICVFSGLQYSQIKEALGVLTDNNAIDDTRWLVYKDIQVAMIVISSIFCCWLFFVGWKLHEEFAWVTFQKVDADFTMRRRYWTFQILLSILKFDVFFFLGFLVQAVVVQTEQDSPLWKVPLALIPISCVLLWGTAVSVRHENAPWTFTILIFYMALTGLFTCGFTFLYAPGTYLVFLTVRPILAPFGCLTILLSLATTVMIYMCLRNFGKGLKPYVCGGREARIMGETFETSLRQEYSLVSQA